MARVAVRVSEIRSKAFFLVMVIFLFFAIANMLSTWPLDKVSFILFAILFVMYKCLGMNRGSKFDSVSLITFSLVAVLILISTILSIDELVFSFEVDLMLISFFTLLTFMVVVGVGRDYLLIIKLFVFSVSIYLAFGVFAWVYSTFTGNIYFVQPLYGKGMPDVFGAISFSTTQQVFGTFAVLMLSAIYFLRKNGVKVYCYNALLLASVISVFVSLNRVWILFLLACFFLFLGKRFLRFFIPVCIFVAVLLVVYMDVMLALGTVESRINMMLLEYDFWLSQDFRHMLFGRPFFDGYYFFMHGRDFDYLECGPFFILINFGLIGLVFASIIFFVLTLKALKVSFYLGFLTFYYLFFVQFMTQEFLSISFWLFIVVVMAIINLERRGALGGRDEVRIDSSL
jgi:hypothetical protein